MEKFTYTIGGKSFVLDKLKLGQLKQLIPYTEKISAQLEDKVDIDIFMIIESISEDISEIIAVVLQEVGTKLQDKNIKELADFLDDNLDYDMAVEIISDFFLITPLSPILNKVAQMMKYLIPPEATLKKEELSG